MKPGVGCHYAVYAINMLTLLLIEFMHSRISLDHSRQIVLKFYIFQHSWISMVHSWQSVLKFYILCTHESRWSTVDEVCWNFPQITTVTLPCSVQNFRTIRRPNWVSWASELFSLRRISIASLRWCHNEHDGVSNHQPRDCLHNRQ